MELADQEYSQHQVFFALQQSFIPVISNMTCENTEITWSTISAMFFGEFSTLGEWKIPSWQLYHSMDNLSNMSVSVQFCLVLVWIFYTVAAVNNYWWLDIKPKWAKKCQCFKIKLNPVKWYEWRGCLLH